LKKLNKMLRTGREYVNALMEMVALAKIDAVLADDEWRAVGPVRAESGQYAKPFDVA